MKNNNEKIEKFIASLMPDSDKKMGSIASASIVVALALCLYAATYERLIEDVLFEKNPNEEIKATLDITQKKEVKDIKRPKAGGRGKPKGNGNPREPIRRGVLKELAALTKNASASPYELMRQQFAKDIDKILKNTNGLQVTGKTSIGKIRGKVSGEFNEGIAAGGSGGIEGAFSDLFGNSAGTIPTKAMKGKIKPPSPTDIDLEQGQTSRSASEIMKVIRTRTPGLRHIYSKFLKKKNGFQGKVTLKFTIAPGGEIISISIVSSTTSYTEFDNEIKNTVARWTFNKVKSGNTTVTVPFTFSE